MQNLFYFPGTCYNGSKDIKTFLAKPVGKPGLWGE